jgi:hypothetical protein
MKRMIALAVLAAAMFPAFAQESAPEAPAWKERTEKDIQLKWRTDAEFLYVEVKAPTTGWVGFGIDAEKEMLRANIIIGCVKDGVVLIEDHYGTAPRAHRLDTDLGGKDNLSEKGGEEADGATILRFRIPLDSGDTYDRPLEAGKEYEVLLAYGATDDLKTRHATRAHFKLVM